MSGTEKEDIHSEAGDEPDAWISYKLEKALSFVRNGYSVSWCPDETNWMDVFLPSQSRS